MVLDFERADDGASARDATYCDETSSITAPAPSHPQDIREAHRQGDKMQGERRARTEQGALQQRECEWGARVQNQVGVTATGSHS